MGSVNLYRKLFNRAIESVNELKNNKDKCLIDDQGIIGWMYGMEKFPITAAGFVTMEAELKNLKAVERPNVIKAIAEARAHGDLSENAEYSAAREKQSFIEGRILELQGRIAGGVGGTEKVVVDPLRPSVSPYCWGQVAVPTEPYAAGA